MKSYKTITTLVDLFNADTEHDVDTYDTEAQLVQADYINNLGVYRPEPDDPTRSVAEYVQPWWYDVRQDMWISYSMSPTNYLAKHREQVSSRTHTVTN